MKSAKIIFTILFILSLFLPSRFARADVAPPPAPQLGGLEPFEYQSTNVQMVYERVEMEIQPHFYEDGDYSFFASRVNVTAYFTMHNNGNSSESMQVIFPLESFSNCRMGFGGGNSYTHYFVNEESFAVVVDGVMAPLQKVATDHPDKGMQGLGDYCDKMSWAGFDVTFPIDEDVVIKVQYVMETMGRVDSMQNIEYILETGAGWSGPIKRGHVIVKFPYVATAENVLYESTPGYQFLYNEVFWSFENLEPTSENNIHVSIISPDTWQRILLLRRELKENPRLPEKWLELTQIYFDISTWHWDNVRSSDYFQKISSTYEKAIADNPDNAELYAKYAEFRLYNWSPRLIRQLTQNEAELILSLLNKSLALAPNNQTAHMVLSSLLSIAPFVTFTPPSTIVPTSTPLSTVTPSITPTATITSTPTARPIVVTVVHTKIVNSTASIQKPTPTVTISPTEVSIENEKQNETNASPIIFGALIIFVTGISVGTFWSRRRKR